MMAGVAIGAATCNESAIGEKLCSAVALGTSGALIQEFSTGHLNHLSKLLRILQTTWNTNDVNELADNRRQAKEACGPALFSLALDTMLSGAGSGIGKASARCFFTPGMIEERLPMSFGVIRSDFASLPVDGKIVARYPDYRLVARYSKLGARTEYEQYVPLHSRPNTFLEKPRQPNENGHNLSYYTGTSYYPKLHQVPEYNPRCGFLLNDRITHSPRYIGGYPRLPGERIDLAG